MKSFCFFQSKGKKNTKKKKTHKVSGFAGSGTQGLKDGSENIAEFQGPYAVYCYQPSYVFMLDGSSTQSRVFRSISSNTVTSLVTSPADSNFSLLTMDSLNRAYFANSTLAMKYFVQSKQSKAKAKKKKKKEGGGSCKPNKIYNKLFKKTRFILDNPREQLFCQS